MPAAFNRELPPPLPGREFANSGKLVNSLAEQRFDPAKRPALGCVMRLGRESKDRPAPPRSWGTSCMQRADVRGRPGSSHATGCPSVGARDIRACGCCS